MKKSKEHPYPHKFSVTISLEEFIEKYNDLEAGQVLEDITLNVAGNLVFLLQYTLMVQLLEHRVLS